jgi:hypothetical protein
MDGSGLLAGSWLDEPKLKPSDVIVIIIASTAATSRNRSTKQVLKP